MRMAFLFPGQGSQYVGMGQELYTDYPAARRVFDCADEVLGFALTKLCFEGPKEELQKTANTQPAVLATSIACYEILREKGIKPEVLAGHSLGEYTALVVAGAFSFEDALLLVRRRGQLMQEAVPLGTGGMIAVLGLDRDKVERITAEAARAGVINAANFNCPGQVVLAGEMPALEEAVKLAKRAGAKRCVPLPVSGPFHSTLMRGAGERLAQALEDVRIRDPRLPVVANVDGSLLRTADEVGAALVRQIYSPVRWEEGMRYLVESGVETFVEVGPGKVLSGLMKKIARPGNTILNVEDGVSLQKVLAHLEEVG
jgi:[acyl-carrier-protein] S-malonyltransferase